MLNAKHILIVSGLAMAFAGSAFGEAGYQGGKATISDGADNKLSIGGWAQFRYEMNFRDGSANSDDDFTHGFETRKTRLNAGGTIWDKNLSYFIEGEFSRSSGNFGLLDAYGAYKFENGVAVKWGQFKPALQREELVSDTMQLTAERSVFNTVFSQGRSQGVELSYTQAEYRLFVGFNDGLQALNTTFDSASEADWALTARGEYRWGAGDWNRLRDFTSWRGEEYAGALGAAAHWQGGGDTNPSNTSATDRRVLQFTADAQLEGDGWNAFAAGTYRITDLRGMDTFDDFGFLVQGGLFVSEQAELFARYDAVIPDSDRGANDDMFNTVTVGLNYYVSPKSHVAKFTADVLYFVDAQADSSSIVPAMPSMPLLASPDDGQFSVRMQFQLVF
jgi:hypothetical protein